jgi:hypothetical protein
MTILILEIIVRRLSVIHSSTSNVKVYLLVVRFLVFHIPLQV